MQQFINNNANAIAQNNIEKQTAELLQSLQKDLQHLKDQLKNNETNPKKKINKNPIIPLSHVWIPQNIDGHMVPATIIRMNTTEKPQGIKTTPLNPLN